MQFQLRTMLFLFAVRLRGKTQPITHLPPAFHFRHVGIEVSKTKLCREIVIMRALLLL